MEHDDTQIKQRSAILSRGASGLAFLRYVLSRFADDRCAQSSAALTYTALLALVPLLALSFAIFAAFDAFEGVRDQVQSFIFENFVPQVGSVVQGHLEDFAGKTGRLTSVGVIFLVITSVLLLATISGTLNGIWRTRQTRNLLMRIPVYWLVLTLTPLLIGAGLVLSGYLFTLARAAGVEEYTGPLARLAGLVPPVVQIAGLTLLYIFVPNYPVRAGDALVGGVTAGIILEILKKGFAFYVITFPTYQTIYGALATFPIFLIWMYLVWNVVLYGAEIAAALPEWRAGASRRAPGVRPPASILLAAAAVLALLLAANRRGGGLSLRHLSRKTGQPAELLDRATELLRHHRYIARSDRGAWLLSRDLETVSLADLHRDLGLSVSSTAAEAARHVWGKELSGTLEAMEAEGQKTMDIPLKTLLAVARDAGEDLARPDGDDDDADEADDARSGNYKNRLLVWLGLAWLAGR
ncbi:MAG: YihY family inner membrane protein [Alphaproteobacteria bacterium]|nr:YihY family inner membrane protein [Alphaproteobacteria bacterium]